MKKTGQIVLFRFPHAFPSRTLKRADNSPQLLHCPPYDYHHLVLDVQIIRCVRILQEANIPGNILEHVQGRCRGDGNTFCCHVYFQD